MRIDYGVKIAEDSKEEGMMSSGQNSDSAT